jgi:hypothetical protein
MLLLPPFCDPGYTTAKQWVYKPKCWFHRSHASPLSSSLVVLKNKKTDYHVGLLEPRRSRQKDVGPTACLWRDTTFLNG